MVPRRKPVEAGGALYPYPCPEPASPEEVKDGVGVAVGLPGDGTKG